MGKELKMPPMSKAKYAQTSTQYRGVVIWGGSLKWGSRGTGVAPQTWYDSDIWYLDLLTMLPRASHSCYSNSWDTNDISILVHFLCLWKCPEGEEGACLMFIFYFEEVLPIQLPTEMGQEHSSERPREKTATGNEGMSLLFYLRIFNYAVENGEDPKRG